MNPMAKAFLGMGMLPVPLLLTQLYFDDGAGASVWPWIIGSVTFGALAAALAEWSERRALAKRVKIEVTPNRVIVDGVELEVPFSSDTHLFKSRDCMTEMLQRAVEQIMSRKRGWLVLRPSAAVRILPAPLFLTEVECDALSEMLEQEFIEPTIEVIVQR